MKALHFIIVFAAIAIAGIASGLAGSFDWWLLGLGNGVAFFAMLRNQTKETTR